MGQQIFPHKWKTFDSHLSSSLCDLFAQDTFTDVTLVSDDQIQFQAHQFILGACSPAMKNILLENSHSHPLIYLRGVMHEELSSILEFIYLGNTRISQDRIFFAPPHQKKNGVNIFGGQQFWGEHKFGGSKFWGFKKQFGGSTFFGESKLRLK